MTHIAPPQGIQASGDVPGPLMNGERLYSPAGAAKAANIPGYRGGPHLNASTIFRHITKGIRTAGGELIRLEAVRIGGRWLTSLEAIARFSSVLTAASLSPSEKPAPLTSKQTRHAAAKAHNDLAAVLGVNS